MAPSREKNKISSYAVIVGSLLLGRSLATGLLKMNQVEFWFIKIPVQILALVVDHRRQDLLSNLISRAQPRRKNPYASWRSNFRVSNTGIGAGRRLLSSVIGIILV